jgi:hypothetical protein
VGGEAKETLKIYMKDRVFSSLIKVVFHLSVIMLTVIILEFWVVQSSGCLLERMVTNATKEIEKDETSND